MHDAHARSRESRVRDYEKRWLASGLMTSGELESNIQRCEPQLPQKWRSDLLRDCPPLSSRITAIAMWYRNQVVCIDVAGTSGRKVEACDHMTS